MHTNLSPNFPILDTLRTHVSLRPTTKYMYHMWLNQWQTHQINLDFETFDGAKEIVIVTDFSAVYQVRAPDRRRELPRRSQSTTGSLPTSHTSSHT